MRYIGERNLNIRVRWDFYIGMAEGFFAASLLILAG
jgi:hypothetical protein